MLFHYWKSHSQQYHLTRFLRGLAGFACGVLGIAAGYFYQPLLQLFGLLILVPSFCYALFFYVGLLIQRLQQDTQREIDMTEADPQAIEKALEAKRRHKKPPLDKFK